ncbi:oxidoreductase [Frondihabitans sucicola]|uniref:Oxidoreductase n=1 Tax=Frondihabitans sucicola TaxID=1268041 RepID=A0ABM8GIB6_9MICO|nr:oxidoreductase [Frondihabitans sucicola]
MILVGVGGFGAVHLANIRRLRHVGRLTLTALVDPVFSGETPPDAPLFPSLRTAIETVGAPSVVVAAVPIPVHASVAAETLTAGCDLLLEKPPFARMDDFEALLELERQTGRVVQVGFQSLGSLAIDALTGADDPYSSFGAPIAVSATGTWKRDRAYWARSPWAGRRSLDGVSVVDGVATNPFAHAIATALRLAGMQDAADVESVELEMYRANAIEGDDTTSLRITSRRGPSVSAALTLCAAQNSEPVVDVEYEHDRIAFRYSMDEVTIDGDTGSERHFGRIDLLENILDHRAGDAPLRVPLASTGAFMRVVEAIRTADDPVRIEPQWIEWRGTGQEAHPVLKDVERWSGVAARTGALFSEVGAPWAFSGRRPVGAVFEGEVDSRRRRRPGRLRGR